MEILTDDEDIGDSLLQEGRDSDHSDGNEDHDNQKNALLLKSLASLTRKNRKGGTQRGESSNIVSDFHMFEGNAKIKVHELLQTLGTSSKFSLSKKQLKSAVRKTKLLGVPLPKPQAEKIKRCVAYQKTSKEISKWDSVVNKNRAADCLEFPLNQPDLRLEPAITFVKRFEAKTPLEKEVASLLSGSDSVHVEDQELTPAEERALKAMSLEEARERLHELQKMRALLSYQEARARRQNKIKSKRYHRILKKERLKKQLAEFEMLKESNPDAALEKLQELDKRRIEERLTLKHKNTGKWAKQNALRSKYDKQARDALSEQLQLSKQLTQKAVHVESDEDFEPEPESTPLEEMEEGESQTSGNLLANYNAWLRSDTSAPAIISAQDNPAPKAVRIKNNVPKKKVKFASTEHSKIVPAKESPDDAKEACEEPEILCETFSVTPPEEPNANNEATEAEDIQLNSSEPTTAQESDSKVQAEEVLVDPSKFIGAKPKLLLSKTPVLMESDDEDGNSNKVDHMTMREAFADDDVLEEFMNAKEDAVQAGKPKDIDLYLPGWGDWGGAGIIPSQRKRRRFLVKAEPAPPRKDQNLGNVIINEAKETQISKHMVSELPFPFKSVQQFETSIAHPVGNTWNPQSSFQDLIRPEVIVKKGKIIEPMSSDEILKNKPRKLIGRNKGK